MLTDEYDVDESDCCGNGCASCILDMEKQKSNSSMEDLNTSCENALLKYRKYELIDKMIVLQDPKIIELKWKLHEFEENLCLNIPPGYHIMMRLQNQNGNNSPSRANSNEEIKPEKHTNLTRPYSPFFVNSKKLEFEILVNLSPNGKMSKYIESLELGDLVEFRGPVGSFSYKENSYDVLLIFTHGVAIASIIRIVENILFNENDMTRMKFYGCFATTDKILFRDKLRTYESYWNFQSCLYFSKEKCSCNEATHNGDSFLNCPSFKRKLKYGEKGIPFRLDVDQIRTILEEVKIKSFRIVISGSIDFGHNISTMLLDLGVNRNDIIIL